jgi:hypothetical protein
MTYTVTCNIENIYEITTRSLVFDVKCNCEDIANIAMEYISENMEEYGDVILETSWVEKTQVNT